MEPDNSKTTVLLGIFVLLGILILGGLVLRFGSLSEIWETRYSVTVIFKNSSSVMKNSPVRLGGQQIGEVSETPTLLSDLSGVRIKLSLQSSVRIPIGSTVRIATAGFMGDAFVQIIPPDELTDKFVVDGAELQGAQPIDLVDSASEIAQKTQSLMNDVQKAVKDLTVSIDRINTGVLAEENLENLTEALREVKVTVNNINQKFLNDENAEAFKTAMADLSTAVTSIKDQAAKFDKVMDGLGPVLDDARGTFTEAKTALQKFGAFADDLKGTKEAVASLKKALDSFSKTLGSVSGGPGLMTALLTDAELKTDFKALISNMKEKGVLFYRDISDREPGAAPPPAPRKIFRN